MAIAISRPLSPEQLAAREAKKSAEQAQELRTEQDLINAYILSKLVELEAANNDND